MEEFTRETPKAGVFFGKTFNDEFNFFKRYQARKIFHPFSGELSKVYFSSKCSNLSADFLLALCYISCHWAPSCEKSPCILTIFLGLSVLPCFGQLLCCCCFNLWVLSSLRLTENGFAICHFTFAQHAR